MRHSQKTQSLSTSYVTTGSSSSSIRKALRQGMQQPWRIQLTLLGSVMRSISSRCRGIQQSM